MEEHQQSPTEKENGGDDEQEHDDDDDDGNIIIIPPVQSGHPEEAVKTLGLGTKMDVVVVVSPPFQSSSDVAQPPPPPNDDSNFMASDHSLRLSNALSTATSHLRAESHGIHAAREYRRISETVVRQRMGRRGGEENGRWK